MIITMDRVRNIISEALYLEKDEVTAEASLMKDLGAESIDFLDIMFRLEKEFSIKIPKGDAEKKARGALSEAEFAIGGVIQPKGIEALKDAMPEIDESKFAGKITMRDIPGLFTVATFDRMVREQLGLTDVTNVISIGAMAKKTAGASARI